MRRVSNCILRDQDQVLMLRKPSRGWWVAPGGKMETRESVKESAVREYKEETGIDLHAPTLRGVFTVVIEEDGETVDEWMLFTFYAENYSGTLLEQSPEGHLEWQRQENIKNLPMAPGDHYFFDHILNHEGLIYGTFVYSREYRLLSYQLDPEKE
ncbi:8-oxo-dGTP diphosphatase [Alteribacter natronophilus]|uniref:8-oxo-dGTP diphosphatase n=1 Tax=Alteribacter natronophilus TaxID=2583810 RepID=UPI00110F14B9|nr:8-oxo-dGTP diphosphatase [Alteribacter natronophilus]TMW72420.1 8-oxo-dGTP diphosphatase [Alteribacter natronophilus]